MKAKGGRLLYFSEPPKGGTPTIPADDIRSMKKLSLVAPFGRSRMSQNTPNLNGADGRTDLAKLYARPRLVAPEQLVALEGFVRQLNATGTIFKSQFGQVPLKEILGTELFQMTWAEGHPD